MTTNIELNICNSDLNIFSENDNNSEKIKEQIRSFKFGEIFDGLCYIKDETLFLDYAYFKYFATKETYDIITQLIISRIDIILLKKTLFLVHINIRLLTFIEIDKHKNFIISLCNVLKDKYPKKLLGCFIHNAPFIFSQIFSIISMVVDKETQNKIKLVK